MIPRVAIALLGAVIIVAIGEHMIENARRRRKLERMKQELRREFKQRFYRVEGGRHGTNKSH